LSDPVIAAILPPVLRGDESAEPFIASRTYLHGTLSKPALKFRDWVLRHAWAIVAVGLATFILAVSARKPERANPQS